LGRRGSFKVFGRWKVVDVRIFLTLREFVPFRAAFFADSAFFLSPITIRRSTLCDLPDCFCAFGGIVNGGLLEMLKLEIRVRIWS
jgi:hypothetical protein